MSQFARIHHLSMIASAIRAETAKLDFSLPEKGTKGYGELATKVEGWERAMRLAEREIKSQSHFNHMIYDQNRFGANSYRAAQSFQSKEGNLDKVRKAVFDVAVALQELVTRYYNGANGGTPPLKGISHALGNLMKSASKSGDEFSLGQQTGQLQAEVRAMTDTLPPAGRQQMPSTGIVDVFTLILAYFTLIKALRKS